MSKEPPASTTFNPSSIHILGRDGAPTPKQPQSSVRPRSKADKRTAKNSTERSDNRKRSYPSGPRPEQQKAARYLEGRQLKREQD